MNEITIFLGSGASAPFEVPTMTGEDGMSNKFENDSKNELTDIEEKSYKILKLPQQSNDLEVILRMLNFLTDNPRQIPYFFDGITNNPDLKSTLSNINEMSKILANLKSKIFSFIKKNCKIDDLTFNRKKETYGGFFECLDKTITTPHPKFYPHYNIFTTNYDIIIDRYIKDKNKEDPNRYIYKNGFTIKNRNEYPEWSPGVYADNATFKLFKLHGSIDWYYLDGEIVKRDIFLTPSSPGETIDGKKLFDAILYPVPEKEIYKDPFFELFSHLKETLKRRTETCIIVGYSFRDEHIKNIFFDAINKNQKKLKIILIDKHPEEVMKNLSFIKDKANFHPIEGEFGRRKVLDELVEKINDE